ASSARSRHAPPWRRARRSTSGPRQAEQSACEAALHAPSGFLAWPASSERIPFSSSAHSISVLCFSCRFPRLSRKDGVNYKKPTRVPAPVYIDLLLSWADERISNPQLFPVEQSQNAAHTHTRADAQRKKQS